MDDYIVKLIQKYQSRGLLLDAMLFVLLAIGTHNPKLVGKDKRLKQYIPEDLDMLVRFVELFKKLITSSNVLTEVSNLSGHLFTNDFPDFPIKFAQNIELMDEHHISAKKICNTKLFQEVGLTDAAIADLAKDQYLILTDDLRLVGKLEKRKIDVINFNHLRTYAW